MYVDKIKDELYGVFLIDTHECVYKGDFIDCDAYLFYNWL